MLSIPAVHHKMRKKDVVGKREKRGRTMVLGRRHSEKPNAVGKD